MNFDELINKLLELKKEGKCTRIKIEYWDEYYDRHLLEGYFDSIGIKSNNDLTLKYSSIKLSQVDMLNKTINKLCCDNGDIIVDIYPDRHRLYFNLDGNCYKAEKK